METRRDRKLVGSPLRVQEQRIDPITNKKNLWITPACAGTTENPNQLGDLIKDHPCVCRNNFFCEAQIVNTVGSPLRVQEQRPMSSAVGGSVRITPACAGTTEYATKEYLIARDHPCVCRNNSLHKLFFLPDLGSPLRVQEQPKK